MDAEMKAIQAETEATLLLSADSIVVGGKVFS
jgi:hypothetical protein